MKTIDFSYFIERYNAGEMSEPEKQWFQKELEGNSKLREEVELRSKTDMVLNNHSAFLLRNKLRDIERKRAEAVTSKQNGKHSALKYAAVITIFVMLGSLFLVDRRNLPENELFERYFKPYEGISASRSLESKTNSDYMTAMDYYKIHDYSNAALYFTKVLRSNPLDMESTMLNGVSNFEEKNYPVAKQSFYKVIDNNDNYFIEDAQWYLAWCYIRTNESARAVEQLNMIKNSESIYRKDARNMLKRIK
jgi:tetratricopeptide (TPR) repeat protein